ncbi:TlpA disulfide reductase family protein [Actinoplanes sp. NPDC051411]|uniref:TlpA family protein disulfide reductase n=1 Tax=unclassified Actinoplanes TaxID=2626549 RepID=UPI0034161A68
MNKRLIAGVTAVLAVAALGVVLTEGMRASARSASAAGDAVQAQVRDETAPELRGRTLDGPQFDLATLRGQVVLVNVWASWCDPCRQELPALAAAQSRWAADGFRVVGIDMRDNSESAHRLLADVGATSLTSVADPPGVLAVAWGARGVPESFLVDRTGRIRWWVQGALDEAWLEQRVPALLAS